MSVRCYLFYRRLRPPEVPPNGAVRTQIPAFTGFGNSRPCLHKNVMSSRHRVAVMLPLAGKPRRRRRRMAVTPSISGI
jgi:hypothetical protein